MDLTYYNAVVLLIVILVVMIFCLWRYKIQPFYERRSLYLLLKKHPEAKGLIEKEQFLNQLFNQAQSGQISKAERKRMDIQDDAFIYGEVEFLPFYIMLDRVKPKPNEIFYDLGSGAGKATFTAAIYFDFAKAYGVELLPGLFDLANSQINKAYSLVDIKDNNKSFKNQIAKIEFINNNFLNVDFSDADVVFVNATCLSYPTWEKLVEKFTHLKPGSRVIVTTKKIEHPDFSQSFHGMTLMSWGMNSINVYIKSLADFKEK